jgi:hypothetical protein
LARIVKAFNVRSGVPLADAVPTLNTGFTIVISPQGLITRVIMSDVLGEAG